MVFIKTFEIYNEKYLDNDSEIFYTKINIENIENTINKILNKHDDICKYYINITDSIYTVSFNVDMNQLEAMCKTAFEIKLFKNNDNNSVVILSNQITEHQQWSEVYTSLVKKFKSM